MTFLDVIHRPREAEPLVRTLVRELIVRGATLRTDIAKLVTRWEFDLSATSTSQLAVTLQDKGFGLLNSGLFDRGGGVAWRDLDLVITVIETGDHDGVPTITVTARARGVQTLKKDRGQYVWRNVAPHQLVRDECEKVGLATVVDPTSAVRAGIQRTEIAGKPATEQESTWDVFGRLANELGFWLFESAGTVVFGRPSWIVQHAAMTLAWQWPTGGDHELQGVPECRNSEDADTVTITASLLMDQAIDYRPGWAVNFRGMHGFEGTFIVTELNAVPGKPFASVTLASPIDPTPTGSSDEHAPIRVGPGFGNTGSVLNARQIAGFAMLAGFSGEGLIIITAIILAESGGDTLSHNDVPPDDSYGLAQVNMLGSLGAARRAQYGLSSNDELYDPLINLTVAFDLSSGGTNFCPWSTYEESCGPGHTGAYREFLDEARDAAASPDLNLGTTTTSPTVEAFVQNALAQAGDRYDLGAGRTDDPDPDSFDCSGLVYWDAHQLGLECGATAYAIWQQCVNAGTTMSVDQAVATRGALLIRIADTSHSSTTGDHVAISLGDGNTIEARGSQYGVGVFGASGREWFTGAMLPGLA